MTELRFIERILEDGKQGCILQQRDAPFAPWRDVPLVTLESQRIAAEEAAQDEQDAQMDIEYGP